jgi:hypothetical protein
VATVARVDGGKLIAAYVSCEGACDQSAHWIGTGLIDSYKNDVEAVSIVPTVSLALTKAGKPRVLAMGTSNEGKKSVAYFACDEACTTDGSWKGTIVSDHEKLSQGIDLALDKNDMPRVVYALNYMIIFGRCDAADCTVQDAPWKITKVESGSDMPPDKIFLYPNCTVGAWFLHSPSLALTPEGKPRIGYQARDISGGFSRPDTTKGNCVAGTDMTWSRLALMAKYD